MDKAFIIDINCLISFDQKVWIIDRINPAVPILRISESEFNIIKSGLYTKQNNKLYFNGKNYFISDDLAEEIRIKAKKEKFDLSNLSFSMREYLDTSIIENIKPIIDLSPLNKIKNDIGDTYLIVSKYMKDKYSKQVDKLIDSLSEEGFSVKGIYWISKNFYDNDSDSNSYKKELILISHLSGKLIKKSLFTNDETLKYGLIEYFDDNSSVIGDIEQISKTISDIYGRSEIKPEFNSDLILNKVTQNKMNRLLVKEIKIKSQ